MDNVVLVEDSQDLDTDLSINDTSSSEWNEDSLSSFDTTYTNSFVACKDSETWSQNSENLSRSYSETELLVKGDNYDRAQSSSITYKGDNSVCAVMADDEGAVADLLKKTDSDKKYKDPLAGNVFYLQCKHCLAIKVTDMIM